MSNSVHFAQKIYQQLTGIHEESYLGVNTSETIVYPYLTYTFDAEAIGPSSEGFYLDIDAFDRNASYGGILTVETLLKKGLDKEKLLTEEALFRFKYTGSTEVSTMDNDLKRRNVRFYVKIDWRK